MPQRTFRTIIRNPTSDLNLVGTFNHLCHGQWTDLLQPPATIPPGGSGGMQSESNGVLTGTEGYAKYDVIRAGTRVGMIYVYWDNPFFGITHFVFKSNAVDVNPDCDFSIPSGSVFDPTGVTFTFGFDEYDHGGVGGGDLTNVTDLLGLSSAGILSTLAGTLIDVGSPVEGEIAYLAGVTGIDEHPELDLSVGDTPVSTGIFATVPPIFGSGSEKMSHKLLMAATPEDWVGRWASENGKVTVNIVLTTPTASSTQLTAAIHDATSAPPLSLTETFVPGPQNLLAQGTSVFGILLKLQAKNPEEETALRAAGATTIDTAIKAPSEKALTRTHFEMLAKNTGVVDSDAQGVGAALVDLIDFDQGAAYLSNGIVLQLYAQLFSSGQLFGIQALYQRVNSSGDLIVNEMMNLVPVET